MELQNIFTSVLNMTVTGSIVILCVLLARMALGKAPRVFSSALWLVVLLRLLCPVSLTAPVSVLSILDAPQTPAGAIEYVSPPVQAPLETMVVEPGQLVPSVQADVTPAEASFDWNFYASRIWLVGVGILAGYGLASYVNLKRKLRFSVPLGRGVREADGISAPFVLGRTIYLPAGLAREERDYILLHEQLHIRHGDPAVKLLFWGAVCLHWFNPLVWLSFFLCGRDMELRCDEAVLKRMGSGIRSDYAQSLLDQAASRRFAPAPLAFGEGDTGRRVKFVLGWKKTKLWIAAPAAVLCAAVMVLTACNPGYDGYGEQYLFDRHYRAEAVLGDGSALPEQIYELWSYDKSLHLRVGSDVWRVTGLEQKRLWGFDLTDDTLEQTLRKENLRSWRFTEGDGWLLRQEDHSVWLVFGDDTVLRLDPTDRVTMKTAYGNTERMSYAILGADTVTERLRGITLTAPDTLVFQADNDGGELTVQEEYHNLQNDKEIVKKQTHTLTRTRDYGYELSVAGEHGDYAYYRVELGLSTYVFRVNFAAPEKLRTVTYAEVGAYITLLIPESWGCEITSLAEDEYSAGIAFHPPGCQGTLRFGYYPRSFGVCGTGLQTEEMTLGEHLVSMGTYDGRELWDFISFGEHFAVWGEGHESWWTEYGDAAMEILASARCGEGTEHYAGAFENIAGDFSRELELAPKDGEYVHFWVENLNPELHCFIRINEDEGLLLNGGESGWVTARVADGKYRFRCACDIGGVNVKVRIIQNDAPTPIG